VEFRETARIALAESFSEVQRTLSWLQNEQRMTWQREVRKRSEKLAQAKSELYRAKLAAMDERAACTEQKKLLERAERALAEAQQKLEHVRKWSRVLDREIMLFKGKCQPIARAVDGELPKGEARLELLIDRLDSYVRLQAPTDRKGTA
jgi:capsule polysaccharide export protein KpsE/RkpR